jgi:hypothetical protein
VLLPCNRLTLTFLIYTSFQIVIIKIAELILNMRYMFWGAGHSSMGNNSPSCEEDLYKIRGIAYHDQMPLLKYLF